jgi:hypothetical protein
MATPLVAVETADGSRVAFTFAADIQTNHEIAVDRLPQGQGIDYTVTSTRGITFTSAPPSSALVWLFNGYAGTAVSTSVPSWATVATIISDAAIELGLISADITDPFASTDPNIIQLLRFLKSGGREIARAREWTFLVREYTFSTVSGTANYALPSDFRNLIAQSGWNRTTVWPLGGPVSSQDWQYRKASPVVGDISYAVRLWASQMYLNPTPTSTQTIAFEYLSTYWVEPSGQTSPTSETPTVATDTICFDPNLIVRKLKLDFLKAKGLDTTTVQMDFDASLDSAKGEDADGPILCLGGYVDPLHLLSGDNFPQTGYGS